MFALNEDSKRACTIIENTTASSVSLVTRPIQPTHYYFESFNIFRLAVSKEPLTFAGEFRSCLIFNNLYYILIQ